MSITVTSNSDPKGAAIVNNELAPVESKAEVKKSVSAEKQDEITEDSDASEEIETSEETPESQDDKETNEETEEKADDEKKTKKLTGFKKAIAKRDRLLADKDKEIEILRKLTLEGKAPAESAPAVAKETNDSSEPNPDSFDSHADYVKAVTKWAIKQDKNEQDKASKEAQVKAEYQKNAESFHTKVAKFQESNDDFDDVIASVEDIKMSIAMQDAILQSDTPPELMYELSKNRKEYERINELARTNPRLADREIHKIEMRLAKSSESSTETKEEIKTTKAPPPLRPVGASGSAKTAKSLSDPNLSQAEYERIRREQIARKA